MEKLNPTWVKNTLLAILKAVRGLDNSQVKVEQRLIKVERRLRKVEIGQEIT